MTSGEIVAVLDECTAPLVVTHTHADLDTVGSAIGLAEAIGDDARVVLPESIKPAAQRLLEQVSTPTTSADVVDTRNADGIVVVDSPSSDRMAPVDLNRMDGPLVVVDHHARGDLSDRATAAMVDTDAGSTAGLVADVIEASEWSLTETGAFALAAGLLDDTGNLAHGTPAEYRLAGDLLAAAGHRGEEVPELINPPPDRSERVACAKAVVRADGYTDGDTLILMTTISHYETAAAHSLLAAHADIAVVISVRSDETRVIGRTGSQAGDTHLPGQLFEPLADRFGGDGGGHAGAGVAKLKTSDDGAVREHIMILLEELVDGTLSPIQ